MAGMSQFVGFDKYPYMPALMSVETYKKDWIHLDYWQTEYKITGGNLAVFLKENDFALLFMLLSLFQHQEELQTMYMSLKYLLYKKIHSAPEFGQNTNPEDAMNYFFDCLNKFGNVMHLFMAEGKSEPKRSKLSLKCEHSLVHQNSTSS